MIVRVARETDASGIREIIRATYGRHYPYSEFYDVDTLRKMILGDDTLVLVAEQPETGEIFGTASVLLEIGAYADLVGEFARLAVVPGMRKRGVGNRLMEERLRRVRDRLHVGMVDARVTHPYSLAIARKNGFAPVGFCPLKDLFRVRESTGIMIKWFGDALALRRNNPRIIPEVQALASLAMDHAGLPMDAVVDNDAPSYPHRGDFDVEELSTDGYSTLLRIERGRTRHREVFGPMRLHYGFFRLRVSHAHYLVARRGERIAGAIGFVRDDVEKMLRIFEVISPDDAATHFLLSELERRCRNDWSIAYIDVEVRADAPRMQRTLLELGFVPVAYIPAYVFHEVERLDVVRMARLLVPLELGNIQLTPRMRSIADLVIASLADQQILPRLGPALHHPGLFQGLTEEQTSRLAAICTLQTFETGDRIIEQGVTDETLYLVLDGAVRIEVDAGGVPREVGTVTTGETVGEMGLLGHGPHAATGTAATRVETARVRHQDLTALLRRRPDLGIVIYRNLAQGLGRKLARTDESARPCPP